MTNEAAELLASKPNVLLDFDGPICSVFGGVGADTVARQLRERLGLTEEHSAEARDPFDILRYAAAEGRHEAAAAERELTRLEVTAVRSALPTTGADELIKTLSQRGQAIVVVSNNSVAAVVSYLRAQDVEPFIHGVSARATADPDLLKPNPHLLSRAINQLASAPEDCVMVGDSVADIQAARSAGVVVIAFANKPDKRERFAPQRPDATIDEIAQLLGSALR